MPRLNQPAARPKGAKILLVDRHPVCREGLESIIRRDKHLRVCGHANDAPSAMSAVAKLKPD
jgi:DNA-binding NarL/FixJ family response regulator